MELSREDYLVKSLYGDLEGPEVRSSPRNLI